MSGKKSLPQCDGMLLFDLRVKKVPSCMESREPYVLQRTIFLSLPNFLCSAHTNFFFIFFLSFDTYITMQGKAHMSRRQDRHAMPPTLLIWNKSRGVIELRLEAHHTFLPLIVLRHEEPLIRRFFQTTGVHNKCSQSLNLEICCKRATR